MAKDRTTYQKMILSFVSFATVALILTLVINWLYPLSYEHDLARRSMTFWRVSYGISVLLLSACVLGISLLCSARFRGRSVTAALWAGGITLLILVVYCIAVVESGPAGFGITTVDIMNAKFFAEWQHLKFLGVISPACVALSAALTWIESRQSG